MKRYGIILILLTLVSCHKKTYKAETTETIGANKFDIVEVDNKTTYKPERVDKNFINGFAILSKCNNINSNNITEFSDIDPNNENHINLVIGLSDTKDITENSISIGWLRQDRMLTESKDFVYYTYAYIDGELDTLREIYRHNAYSTNDNSNNNTYLDYDDVGILKNGESAIEFSIQIKSDKYIVEVNGNEIEIPFNGKQAPSFNESYRIFPTFNGTMVNDAFKMRFKFNFK